MFWVLSVLIFLTFNGSVGAAEDCRKKLEFVLDLSDNGQPTFNDYENLGKRANWTSRVGQWVNVWFGAEESIPQLVLDLPSVEKIDPRLAHIVSMTIDELHRLSRDWKAEYPTLESQVLQPLYERYSGATQLIDRLVPGEVVSLGLKIQGQWFYTPSTSALKTHDWKTTDPIEILTSTEMSGILSGFLRGIDEKGRKPVFTRKIAEIFAVHTHPGKSTVLNRGDQTGLHHLLRQTQEHYPDFKIKAHMVAIPIEDGGNIMFLQTLESL